MLTKSIFALSIGSLLLSSCNTTHSVQHIEGDYVKTAGISINDPNVDLVRGRVTGESQGFALFGLFNFAAPSQTEALENMYEKARQDGYKLEGDSVAFANTSIEKTSSNFILFSRPSIKVSGDLVRFVDKNDKE